MRPSLCAALFPELPGQLLPVRLVNQLHQPVVKPRRNLLFRVVEQIYQAAVDLKDGEIPVAAALLDAPQQLVHNQTAPGFAALRAVRLRMRPWIFFLPD